MESRAQLTQRQKALRREDEREQTRLQVQTAVYQANANEHRDDCNRKGRDQFKGQGGKKRHAQSLQCGGAVGLAHGLQRRGLSVHSAQTHQHRQATGKFHQVVRQLIQRLGRFTHALKRVLADQDHEKWHQRERHDDHNGRDPVCEQDSHNDDRRHAHSG